jgi:hypothetical protein
MARLPILTKLLRCIPRVEGDENSVPTTMEFQIVKCDTGRLGIAIAPPNRPPTADDVVFELSADELDQIHKSACEAGFIDEPVRIDHARIR